MWYRFWFYCRVGIYHFLSSLMAEGPIDLNKLREQAAAQPKEDPKDLVKKLEKATGQASQEIMTADAFAALPGGEQKRIAEENDANPRSFLRNLRLKEAMRRGGKAE